MNKYLCKIQVLIILFFSMAVFFKSALVFSVSPDRSYSFIRAYDQKVLLKKDSARLMSPASLTKLFTSAALLDFFGAHHRFETRFAHTGYRKGKVIHGDIVIVGGGNPLFVSEDLWLVIRNIYRMGIREVKGGIYIDNTLFRGKGHSRWRRKKYLPTYRPYDAPVSAYGLNFNSISVTLYSDRNIGQKARVQLYPYDLKHIKIDSTVKLSSHKSKVRMHISGSENSRLLVHLRGKLSKKEHSITKYFAPRSPHSSSGKLTKAFFEASGIKISGKLDFRSSQKKLTTLLSHKSPPLSDMIKSLNEYSNNYVADVLVHTLGAHYSKQTGDKKSGTYEKGIEYIESFLQKKIKIKNVFFMENASGLSPKNRFSSDQITQLLLYMIRKSPHSIEYIASLPTSGYSGTLQDRFTKDYPLLLKGKLRAKTGTLTQPVIVANLAGYFQHPKHGWIVFSFLENTRKNQTKASLLQLRKQQEITLSRLYKIL